MWARVSSVLKGRLERPVRLHPSFVLLRHYSVVEVDFHHGAGPDNPHDNAFFGEETLLATEPLQGCGR
jgi:hypothetical protein